MVYVAVNTYWEDVQITLPDVRCAGFWYLSVNTWGDEKGRYCYPEEVRIDREFLMRPRSVAVFHVKKRKNTTEESKIERDKRKSVRNREGGEPVLKFAVPSIIAMLVSSLYNIVDEFFIGQISYERRHLIHNEWHLVEKFFLRHFYQ